MWPRKRLDIGWLDIATVRAALFFRWNRRRAVNNLLNEWPTDGHTVPTLSVRSGLHLILGQLDWPKGSEILMSAMTIPDMARIVRHHGYTPVPVDLDLDTAAPTLETLERATTPLTRGLLFAHLLGTRADLTNVLEFAADHEIAVLEDCAQAFAGSDWTGTPGCLASMFSFGTIKTSTALGGAIMAIRDSDLATAVILEHDRWPIQGRLSYMSRIARAMLMKLLAYRPLFAAFRLTLAVCRRNFDQVLNNFVRGFPGDELIRQIQRRPGTPLLVLLCRRLRRFDPAMFARRVEIGERLRELTNSKAQLLGQRGDHHTFWIFPVISHQPRLLICRLRREGFDATQGKSMEIVAPPDGRADTAPTIRAVFDRIVYLPLYSDLPDREVERMGRVVSEQEAASR